MRFIESHGKKDSGNMVIEADNLDAMRELLKTMKGRIDVITTDPPYNTEIDYIGYKDSDYSEGWNKFISERLDLAYEMLSEKGVIFIAIDENELMNLMSVCYRIFGKENVNILVWPKIDPQFDINRIEKPIFNVKSAHEYIVLCYKNKKNTYFNDTTEGKPLESIVSGYGTTSSAKDEIADLLGDRGKFSTPKPVRLEMELINIASNKDSIVMDFFAGSGTTGHAVMSLNANDSGNRRFILITNNESDICRKVTIPRLDAAIKKYNLDSGFDFFSMY